MNTTSPRKIRKAGVAAVLGGAMFTGALFLPAVASAQTTDEGEAATTRAERKEARKAALLETLASLGISSDAVETGRDAGQTLAQIAEAEGVGRTDLVDGLIDAAEARIDAAVAEGRLTEEQAAEKIADLDAKIEQVVDREPGQRRGPGQRVSNLAETLGLTTDELQAARAEGQTLAEIAAGQGIAEADLVDSLVADITERVDAAVEEGRIDADEAAEKLAEIEERVGERVNAEPGDRPERGDRPGRGDRGQRGGDTDAGLQDA